MRQIVLDTETTGLNAKLGDRIIEIGCVELLSRRISERALPRLPQPGARDRRGRHAGARPDARGPAPTSRSSPRWRASFLDYVRGAELIIHNADFDVEFLDMELARAGLGKLARPRRAGSPTRWLSARELHPGKKNSLDALCERYFVDNSQPHAARRAARRAAARRVLPRDDARPGEPDDGARGAGARRPRRPRR